MNKKGFATSTIVFALLSVFLISISILLVTITNTSKTKNTLNEKVVSNIEYGSNSLNDIEKRLEELENSTLKLDNVYPVGSIYMSNNLKTVEEVHNALGGTWEKYSEGRTIIGDGTTTDESGNALVYNANQIGGNTTQILKTDNLPSHNHSYVPNGNITSLLSNGTTSSSGEHTHTLSTVLYKNPDPPLSFSEVIFYEYPSGYAAKNSGLGYTNTAISKSGSHEHTVTGTITSTFKGIKSETESTGLNKSFSVQDPYIVTYIYKRVK